MAHSWPLLEVRGLSAGYDTGSVLFDIDLEIETGEIVALLGRNGMGKTTLMRSLFGLVRRHAGVIRFGGEPIGNLRADQIAHRGLALVPEGRHIFPNLSVRENLIAFAVGRGNSPRPWNLERVYELFPQLSQRASHRGDQLSGGEQQMLAIGRALMTNPRLLLFDEATEGLAPQVRDAVWHCLDVLKAAGHAVLIVDRHIDRLARLARRHIILERGRIAWQGTSAALERERSVWERLVGV